MIPPWLWFIHIFALSIWLGAFWYQYKLQKILQDREAQMDAFWTGTLQPWMIAQAEAELVAAIDPDKRAELVGLLAKLHSMDYDGSPPDKIH